MPDFADDTKRRCTRPRFLHYDWLTCDRGVLLHGIWFFLFFLLHCQNETASVTINRCYYIINETSNKLLRCPGMTWGHSAFHPAGLTGGTSQVTALLIGGGFRGWRIRYWQFANRVGFA